MIRRTRPFHTATVAITDPTAALVTAGRLGTAATALSASLPTGP